jgi:hypothetical protein
MLEYDSRCFIDIVDVHTPNPGPRPPMFMNMTYYGVGKLAFNILPILLSRIQALGGSRVHEVTPFLRSYPPFYLIKNDPLELEKFKVARAIEEFLKVRFYISLVLFSAPDHYEFDRKKAVYPCLFYYLVRLLGESRG